MKPLIDIGLPVPFLKLNWHATLLPPYITQLYLIFTKIVPNLFQFTLKLDFKMPTTQKITQKLQKCAQSLLATLVTFSMSGGW